MPILLLLNKWLHQTELSVFYTILMNDSICGGKLPMAKTENKINYTYVTRRIGATTL